MHKVRTILRRFDVSGKEYQKVEEQLSKRFQKPAVPEDIVWAILSEKLLDATRRNDWQEMQALYWEQARLLYEQGKDFFKVLQEAARSQLMAYKSGGVIEEVEILAAGDSCEQCKAIASREVTIKQALETMPIPVKDCGRVWCRCTYAPVV